MTTMLATFAVYLAAASGAQVVAPPAPPPTSAPAVDTVGKPDAVRIAAATHLVEQMRIEQTLNAMFVQLAPNFASSVIGSMLSDPQSKGTVETLIAKGEGGRDRLVGILSQEFLASIARQYPAMKNGMAQEYAATFTTAELEAIIAFYSAGPGAKFLAMMPQLQQKMSAVGQELGRAAGMEAGQRAFARAAREMLPATGKKAT